MIHPLPTFENIPWKTAQPVNFQATVKAVPYFGAYRFDPSTPVDLLGSDRANYGSLYLFDSWNFGTNLSEDDWRACLQAGSNLSLGQSQGGPTLFRTPIPLVNTASQKTLRAAWLPAGSPSMLQVSVNGLLKGDEMLAYDEPALHLSFLAYEITDSSYMEAILRAWQEVGDATDPLLAGDVRLVSGQQTLRSYH